MEDKIKLIIDDRERAVIQHDYEFKNINWEIKRIHVGDYAVVHKDKLLAVFERKTYEDFAASFKDGRHQNRHNLINIKKQTKCAIYYIVEGPLLPKYNETFARCPYYAIESAIDHLIVRDGFTVIFTRDTQHTAMRLARFIKSMESLKHKHELPTNCNTNIYNNNMQTDNTTDNDTKNNNTINNDIKDDDTTDDDKQLLIKKTFVNDVDIVREIWSKFKGISVVTADIFMKKYTIGDIIRGVSSTNLENIKYPNGKKINTKLVNRLKHIDRMTEIKLLSAIPGISKMGALQILSGITLKQLLSYNAETISIKQINQKKIGIIKAERIKKYLEWKIT